MTSCVCIMMCHVLCLMMWRHNSVAIVQCHVKAKNVYVALLGKQSISCKKTRMQHVLWTINFTVIINIM